MLSLLQRDEGQGALVLIAVLGLVGLAIFLLLVGVQPDLDWWQEWVR